MLPEAASGTLEPRHAVVPLRVMCPHAELLLGRATALDEDARHRSRRHRRGGDRRRLRPARRRARGRPSDASDPGPGRARSRIQVPGRGDLPPQSRPPRARGGSCEPGRYRPPSHVHLRRSRLCGRGGPRRAVRPRARRSALLLVEPSKRAAAVGARRRGTQDPLRHPRRRSATTPPVSSRSAGLISGSRRRSSRWTRRRQSSRTAAASRPGPSCGPPGSRPIRSSDGLGLPLDDRGRIVVDPTLRVEGRENVWALGDGARVPNEATPGVPDPPTCQHALRQARRLARNLKGEHKPYRYRMLGQVATLGRYKGTADVLGCACTASRAGS